MTMYSTLKRTSVQGFNSLIVQLLKGEIMDGYRAPTSVSNEGKPVKPGYKRDPLVKIEYFVVANICAIETIDTNRSDLITIMYLSLKDR